MDGTNNNCFNGEEPSGEDKRGSGPLCESEGLKIDSDCMLRKSGDASPAKASPKANDEVRVVSEVTEDVCAETPFNVMDPQQCMAAFLESVKLLELVVCENHNLNTMNSMKSVDEIEHQMMNLEDVAQPPVLSNKHCESYVQTLLQENAIAKPSECVKVDCTTVVGENAARSIKKHKTPTPLKDLVIDVTDDDLSIDLQDFALASPDSEDNLKGQLLASNSQPGRDNGKRLFDSRAHPSQDTEKGKFVTMSPDVERLGKQLFQTPPSDPCNKRQKSTLGTPSFSKGGNVSQKTVKISSSGKGRRGSGKERGAGIPKMYKTLFRPTFDMELSTKEAQVSAYIFGSGLDFNEVFLSIGDTLVTREEFYCFLPGRAISAKMIKHVALKLSVMQHYYSGITTWCFPPYLPVVNWMEMDDSFQPNLIGVLKEVHVRVKTPLALEMGQYNLFKRQTEAYSLAKWNEFN
ncbi:hypothetical protein RIF29_10497 [Crotalaria pallida]|uniref:Uncharacterized protein n=1 Tax=Crotalaria pallida TaxID=3830 RepID=A0AAN9IKT4_CROPI